MCFSRNISQWRLNIDKIFLPWTDYTAMLFLRLFPNSQPQTTPAVPSPKTSLTILACLLSLLLLLSAPLQNLCARGVGPQNTKIKHVLKISEPNWKLSLKFSMTPGPGKLQKLIICYRRKRKGNNLGYWLHTSNGNLPPQNSWHSQLKHTKLRLIPPLLWRKKKNLQQRSLKYWCPHQISIIVIPGFIQLITYFLTCLCASAASRKSFQISSLAWSSAFFSSLVILQAAVRLRRYIKHVMKSYYNCSSRYNFCLKTAKGE